MLRTMFKLGGYQAFNLLVAVLRGKVFAVLLGPAGFGVVATIDQLVVSIGQVANLGLPLASLKFLSRDHSRGEAHFRRSYAALLRILAAIALVATIAAVAYIPANLHDIDPGLGKYRGAVLLALLGIPFVMLLEYFANVFASRRLTHQSIRLTTLSGLVLLVSGAIGCWYGGIVGIYWASVPASLVLIVAIAIYVRVKMHLRAGPGATRFLGKLASGSPIFKTAALVYVAVGSYSCMMLLARYQTITHLSEEAAGLLQAVLAIALSIGAILTPANSLYFTPYVNRDIPYEEKFDVAERFMPRLIFLYCLVALPIVLFPGLVLNILFSSQFMPAAVFLYWFIAWQFLAQVARVYIYLLFGLDDVRGFCLLTVIGTLLSIALCLWLIPLFGLAGIGLAFAAGAFTTACLTAIRLYRKFNFRMNKRTPLLALYVMFGIYVIAAIGHLTPEISFQGLFARASTALVFVMPLWLFLPKPYQVEIARRISLMGGRAD